MLLTIIFLSLFAVLFLLERKRRAISHEFRHIPGIAEEYPVIGNLFALRKLDPNDFKHLLDVLCPQPICKVTGFGSVMFTVSDASCCQKILLSPKFHLRDATIRFLEMEAALFTSKYENWKLIRKPLNLAFSKQCILSMLPTMNRHVDELCRKIEQFTEKKEAFDIYNVLAHFEIDEICETILKSDYRCDQNLVDMLQSSTDNIGKRVFNPIYHPEFIYRHSSVGRVIRGAHAMGTKIFKPMIMKSIDDTINGNKRDDTKYTVMGQLLSIGQDGGRKLTYEEIEDNVKTFITAGFETQAHAIGYTLLMLALHPEVEKKVYQEICEFYSNDTEIDAEKVRQMEYLDMVVNETLRLYPVAPLNLRTAMEDTYIDDVGLIPKGTTMFIAMYKLHRNPTIWGPNAEKFDPENFSADKMKDRPPFSYLPFGGGARNCIGLHYAHYNLRITLVKLLAKFKFTTDLKFEDISFKYGISLKLSSGYMLKVRHR
ncbi:probable cytochrome P450 313a4 [Culicoides brevitarsis]|uniref:probable cytochrome P450 313a4 n=1 Tax=Culicoides brevitarsis TaxID=469753 RepID=UPI00307B51DC